MVDDELKNEAEANEEQGKPKTELKGKVPMDVVFAGGRLPKETKDKIYKALMEGKTIDEMSGKGKSNMNLACYATISRVYKRYHGTQDTSSKKSLIDSKEAKKMIELFSNPDFDVDLFLKLSQHAKRFEVKISTFLKILEEVLNPGFELYEDLNKKA